MPRWWNGLHSRLKICHSQGFVGSSPTRGTTYMIKSSNHASLPYHFYCFIDNSYLGKKMPIGKTECLLHSVYSKAGQHMLTHVLLESGAHWSGLPLIALSTKEKIENEHDASILEPWGGMGDNITTNHLSFLEGLKVELINKNIFGRHTGIIIDWSDGYSRYPQEHKPLSLINLENGQFCLLPNNYFALQDKHFVNNKSKENTKFYKRNEKVFWED